MMSKFGDAEKAGALRVGMEQSKSDPAHLRVVLQFHVGSELSDLFFNARTGYRAQFRIDWRMGLQYNADLIDAFRNQIVSLPRSELSARLLTSEFEDCGPHNISWAEVLDSLDRYLSKVWFCARLIGGDGQVTQLPSGVTGPRLRLDDGTTWVALSRDDADAWLDVKGGFVGSDGLYQPKDPIDRAKRLEATGEA